MRFQKSMCKKQFVWLFFSLLIVAAVGCGGGSNQAILPTGQLTEEQKAAVKAADKQVDEEESQGNFNKRKR